MAFTRSRRKPPRRRCRPTSSLGRSDRPLALLLSSVFSCSETLLARILVALARVRDLLLRAKHLFVAAKRALAGRALHRSNGATVVGNRFREIHLRSRKWPGCRSTLKALMVPNGADVGVYVRGSLVGFSVGQNV